MSDDNCTVCLADWYDENHQEALRQVRYQVFVVEQSVPEELEWTGDDGDCIHALAYDSNDQVVGTGRLDNDGHVGRMAVLSSQRGKGTGRQLLHFLIEKARDRGDKEVILNAQTHALGFYQREGFEAYGPEFMDAGIPHRSMLKLL